MDYLIGDVARFLGLSIESVRNYEKSGIITPKREEDSKYRKYSYLDVTSLIRARMYRSLGYTLKETQELVNDMDISDIMKSMQDRKNELQAEHDLLINKIQCIDELLDQMEHLGEKLNCVEICEIPAFYRMEFSKNGEIYQDKEHIGLISKWLDYTPFVHVSSRYNGADVYGGIAIREKYAGLFSIHECQEIRYEPAGLCVRIRVMEHENGFSDVSCVDDLKKFADYHRFTLSQDIIGHTVIGTHKQKGYKRYREISAKINFGA